MFPSFYQHIPLVPHNILEIQPVFTHLPYPLLIDLTVSPSGLPYPLRVGPVVVLLVLSNLLRVDLTVLLIVLIFAVSTDRRQPIFPGLIPMKVLHSSESPAFFLNARITRLQIMIWVPLNFPATTLKYHQPPLGRPVPIRFAHPMYPG